MRYLLSRLGLYVVAGFLSITFNFFLPRFMPGDPAAALFGRFQGRLKPEALDALRHAFGFSDAPFLSQYFSYLKELFQGNLGVSVAYFPAPVSEVIMSGLGWTMLLAGVSVLIAFVLGTSLGVLLAWRRGSVWDTTLPPLLALLGAFPYFWTAMALLFFLGFQMGWFPLRHAHSAHLSPEFSASFAWDVWVHLALPAFTLVLTALGGWMLSMRNNMISVLGTDYITLARAKGLSEKRVMWAYAARNALLPNVTGLGMALGFVVSGALLTEIIFSYPGVGYLMLQAIRAQDYPLMQGLFLNITFAVLLANFLVDIAYQFLDPRTRSDG
ncbi:MAG: peptide ABC transporter permease [Myxococcales bacterium]|nr:peptide ABC transporter permease [Myxococcales bacterium]